MWVVHLPQECRDKDFHATHALTAPSHPSLRLHVPARRSMQSCLRVLATSGVPKMQTPAANVREENADTRLHCETACLTHPSTNVLCEHGWRGQHAAGVMQQPEWCGKRIPHRVSLPAAQSVLREGQQRVRTRRINPLIQHNINQRPPTVRVLSQCNNYHNTTAL